MCKENATSFDALYAKNVNDHVEKKDKLSYLSWAYAWAEFKKVFPDATYDIKMDDQRRCYFGDDTVGYMVYTSVTAGGLTYNMWLPIMDNNNKSMKRREYTYKTRFGEKTVDSMTSFDVNKSIMRCLVKNLAMFGLGLYIYAGEDLPEGSEEVAQQPAQQTPTAPAQPQFVCSDCGIPVDPNMAARTHRAFGATLCAECGKIRHALIESQKSNQ